MVGRSVCENVAPWPHSRQASVRCFGVRWAGWGDAPRCSAHTSELRDRMLVAHWSGPTRPWSPQELIQVQPVREEMQSWRVIQATHQVSTSMPTMQENDEAARQPVP